MNEPVSPTAANPPATGLRLVLAKILREIRRFTSQRLGLHFGKPFQRRRKRIKPHRRIPPAKLRQLYSTSTAFHLPDNFVIYRIIGNDLVPRHAKGQSRANVAFILEHEPVFEACEKRWIINRIVDPDEEAAIIALLEKHQQPYIHIPFDRDEYRQLRWDAAGLPTPDWIFSKAYERLDPVDKQLVQLHLRRHKTLYAMNNNGARNTALTDGRSRAKWVLPLDGNCYFTAEGFASLRQHIKDAPWHPYVILSMARIIDNTQLLAPGFAPVANEEPQVVFRCDAGDCFDESIPYGRRPKVELLWRLGVPGPWDEYSFYAWDAQRPPYSPEAGRFQQVGWVARLASGRADLEVGREGFINRGTVRGDSIISTLDRIDARILSARFNSEALAFYDHRRLLDMATAEPGIFADLMDKAEQAARRGPHSVTQKTTLPPSGDLHDYWHPAPYWWPDPSKKAGTPYQWRDGQRLPGTRLYDPNSGQFDRTRLQLTMDDSTILTLAGVAAGRRELLEKAALLVRSWFIDPATRMNPHLKYAQVRRGHNGDEGAGTGIIEFKDLHYFLDAVRLMRDEGTLTTHELDSFRGWLAEYSTWLTTSAAGMNERRGNNNHGTLYDVQLLSIALFLGDYDTAAEVCNGAWLRFSCQFAPNGSMPHELKRTKPRHYASFGLVAWTTLARLMSACGEDLWGYSDSKGRSLEKAAAWLADAWPDRQWAPDEREELPTDRLEPLWQDCRNHFPELAGRLPTPAPNPSSILHPDLGHAPFWMMAGYRHKRNETDVKSSFSCKTQPVGTDKKLTTHDVLEKSTDHQDGLLWEKCVAKCREYFKEPKASALLDVFNPMVADASIWRVRSLGTIKGPSYEFHLFEEALSAKDSESAIAIAERFQDRAGDEVERASLRFILAAWALLVHRQSHLADVLIGEGYALRDRGSAVFLDRLMFGVCCRIADPKSLFLLGEVLTHLPQFAGKAVNDFVNHSLRFDYADAELLEFLTSWSDQVPASISKSIRGAALAIAFRLGDMRAVDRIADPGKLPKNILSKILALSDHLEARKIPRAWRVHQPEIGRMSRLFNHLVSERSRLIEEISCGNSRIAIIGNSACEKGKRKGQEIDAHEMVIRFNFFSLDPVYTKDYGSRTDIHARVARPDEKMFAKSIAVGRVLICEANILFLARNWNDMLELFENGVSLACFPDGFHAPLQRQLNTGPSSGLAVTSLVSSLCGPRSIFNCYGFSFTDQIDGSGTPSHYFGSRNPAMTHNWIKERQIFETLTCASPPLKPAIDPGISKIL